METTSALLFTAYMLPVNLIDNVLRPIIMGRGLKTPMLVILIGVIGGTLAYGIIGLFLGPIVLAVIWELLAAWLREREAV
jgi:predicted PurR-regulated permease PerM